VSVLTIVRSVMGRLSLTQPSVVATSTDRNVVQMFELLKEEAEDQSKKGAPGGWQSLTREWSFITVAQAVQTNTPIPTDLRRLIPDSFFNRSTMRPVNGPLTPQQWQLLQARPAVAAVYLMYRERDGDFLINPIPPAGETIAFEYVSSYWAISSGGTAKASFTADEDTTYLDEELLKLGLRWRWLAAKGLTYGEEMASYERAVALALGDDGGAGALNQGGPVQVDPWWRANLPEGNFGL
jgi:hypothetical protein